MIRSRSDRLFESLWPVFDPHQFKIKFQREKFFLEKNCLTSSRSVFYHLNILKIVRNQNKKTGWSLDPKNVGGRSDRNFRAENSFGSPHDQLLLEWLNGGSIFPALTWRTISASTRCPTSTWAATTAATAAAALSGGGHAHKFLRTANRSRGHRVTIRYRFNGSLSTL